MQEALIKEGMVLLFAWLIMLAYCDWQLIRKAQAKRQARRPKAKRRGRGKKAFRGVTKKPECGVCRQETIAPQLLRSPPPLMFSKRGPKRSVDSGLHYCPKKSCQYYGWVGRGNITSNGKPNGGEHRQLYCKACKSYFMETKGTIFYRKRYRAEQIAQVLAAMAEGLGIRAAGRVFGVEPETILTWLVEASKHFEAFNQYMLHQLEVKQVQLDEMYGVVRGYQVGELSEAEAIARLDKKKRAIWLWTAIEPVSKFWLAYVVGEREGASAWAIVHRVASLIKEGIIPLFITDGNRAYEAPILSHYGQWREPEEGERKARWVAQPGLNYAQVVKKRRRRRIVSVSKRIVFGTMDGVKEILSPFGWQINTAFVERLNLTIRHLVAGLGRRVNTLLLSPEALERQVALAQTYYNFCLPSRSLEVASDGGSIARTRTPAMALDVTDHIWSLKEVLLFRPPPFPQGS